MKKTDIVVIGAGIAGLTAAIYLKRGNADFVVLENSLPGGVLNKLHKVENYPGIPNTTGSDILISLMYQVRNLGIEIKYGSVQTILKEEGGFEVVTDQDSYDAKAVIVATGRKIQGVTIKGEKEFVGRGVSYCATCDGNFFKGADVAVVGNNDIVLEESLYLANLVNKLYLCVPAEELEGTPSLLNKVKEKQNIEVILNSNVEEIVGDDVGVSAIRVNGKDLPVWGVFPFVGTKSSDEFLFNLKPETDQFGVKVNDEMMSNVAGLYFAGDITSKKLKQLVTAASDGAIAATEAMKFVH